MLDGFSKNPFLLLWVEMAGEHIHQHFLFISTLWNMLVWMSLMVFLPVGSFVFALSDHQWLNNQWLNPSWSPKDTFYLSNLHRLFNCCSHLNCQCDVNGLLCSVAMWDVSLGQPCIQHIASHSRCINTVSDFITRWHSSSPISSICYTEATIYLIPLELKWGTQVVKVDPWRKDWSTVELLFKEPCFHCHRGQEEHAFNVRNVLLSGCSITQRSIHLHRRRWSESGKSSSVTQKWHTLLSCVVIAYLFCGILLVNNIKNMCMITWFMKYSHLEVSKNMKVHLRRVVPRVNYCFMMEILRFEWWVPSMSPMGKWGDVLWQVLYQDVGDESQLQWRLTHPLWEEPTLRPENWYQVQLWVLFWYLLKTLQRKSQCDWVQFLSKLFWMFVHPSHWGFQRLLMFR